MAKKRGGRETFGGLLEGLEGLEAAQGAEAVSLWVAVMQNSLSALAGRPQSVTQMSEREAQVFREGGPAVDRTAVARVRARSAAADAELRATAASVAQVAAALGVTEARVRQRCKDRTLWAIRDGQRWTLPIIQFAADPRRQAVNTSQIHGLDEVFPAIPQDWHPLSVRGFLATPQSDLVVDGQQQTPLDWLGSGGDVDAVLRMVQAAEYEGL
jgi:hypothetical protein